MNTTPHIKSKGKVKYQMTPELEKYLGKVEEDIKNNRNIDGPFHSAEELNKYLDSK